MEAMLPGDIFKHPLRNLTEFVERMSAFSGGDRVYRGQGNSSWPLLPKAGRPEFLRPFRQEGYASTFNSDLGDFVRWRRNAIAFCDSLPEKTLECLAYAQHYGLATRLLDWTDNPLVALFFAVESEPGEDGIVYCYQPGTATLSDDHDSLEPIYETRLYRPRPFDHRIQAQQGLFTLHPQPASPFPVSEPFELVPINGVRSSIEPWMNPLRDLTAFPIPMTCKRTMMSQLKRVGVTRKALFPDLEGLSNYINWEAREDVLNLTNLRNNIERSQTGPG